MQNTIFISKEFTENQTKKQRKKHVGRKHTFSEIFETI